MKQYIQKTLFALAISFMFTACSAPKYTYYFSEYSTKKIDQAEPNHTAESIDATIEVQEPPLASVKEENSMASIANEPVALSSNKNKPFTPIGYQHPKESFKKDGERQLPVRKGKSVNDYTKKEGDKNKNRSAKAGFIFSLIGLVPVLIPFAIVGIILSAKGLKSEKRKLAIAGLVIGIVGVLLGAFVIFIGVAGAGG